MKENRIPQKELEKIHSQVKDYPFYYSRTHTHTQYDSTLVNDTYFFHLLIKIVWEKTYLRYIIFYYKW